MKKFPKPISKTQAIIKEWNKVRHKYPNFIIWLDKFHKSKKFPKPF